MHELRDSGAHIDEQPQSFLFNRLPAEIRNEIWEYTLTAQANHDDRKPSNLSPDSNRLKCASYFGAEKGKSVSWSVLWSVLLTYRRVYLETALLPAFSIASSFGAFEVIMTKTGLPRPSKPL